MTKNQLEIIKSEIRRHLALYQMAQEEEIRIHHLLVADALCATIDDPVAILSK